MNTSLNSLRSQAMSLANRLKKEKGLNKSDALKVAWIEVKKANNYQPKKSKTLELKSIDSMNTLEKVQEYKKINQLIDELSAYMDTIKQSLIAEMETQQLQELKID